MRTDRHLGVLTLGLVLQAIPTTCPVRQGALQSVRKALLVLNNCFLLLPKEPYNLILFLFCSGFQEAERNLEFNISKFLSAFALLLFSFCQKELYNLFLSFACNARNFNAIKFIISKQISCHPPGLFLSKCFKSFLEILGLRKIFTTSWSTHESMMEGSKRATHMSCGSETSK